MNIYVSSKKGLTIVIKPMKIYTDNQGNPKREEGKKVQFINGKFSTDDKETIDFLNEYMKKNPGLISKVEIPVSKKK